METLDQNILNIKLLECAGLDVQLLMEGLLFQSYQVILTQCEPNSVSSPVDRETLGAEARDWKHSLKTY